MMKSGIRMFVCRLSISGDCSLGICLSSVFNLKEGIQMSSMYAIKMGNPIQQTEADLEKVREIFARAWSKTGRINQSRRSAPVAERHHR